MRISNVMMQKSLLAAAVAGAVLVSSCGKSDDVDTEFVSCQTYLNPALTASPATGKVTFGGTFPANETITVSYQDAQGVTQTQTPVATPGAPAGTGLTLSGLPSGTRQFVIHVHCPNGPAAGEELTYTLTVK
jgi:hypothetical protein